MTEPTPEDLSPQEPTSRLVVSEPSDNKDKLLRVSLSTPLLNDSVALAESRGQTVDELVRSLLEREVQLNA